MIIDLTMTIEEGLITFPVHWHPVVEITQLGRFHVEGRESRKLVLGTHTGTHVDAPRHFVRGGKSIDQIDLAVYYGEARVLDFSDLPDRSEVSLEMLKQRIGENFPPRIIFRYDWDQRTDNLQYFSHHPYLSEEVCEWLTENGVCLVGSDTPMPDDPRNGRGSDRDSPNHKILLNSGVAILEYLVNLASIPVRDFVLCAFPLRISGADGSPVRALAIVNEQGIQVIVGIEEWLCDSIEQLDPSFGSLSWEEKQREDLFSSGRLDSMALMNLFLEAESEFDFMFTPESFQDRRIQTVFGLTAVICELKYTT